MSLMGAENIRLLKNLFTPNNEDSDSEDEIQDNAANRQLGPGDIGTNTHSKTKKKRDGNPDEHIKNSSYSPLQETNADEPKTIEEWERREELECEKLLEFRPRPDFKISYKQTVGTEDLFLQMSGKTPGTASCESMIIDIFLNGETAGIHNIDLTVLEQQIIVKSPKYYLDLTLPHKIVPDKGNAAWLSEEKILKLTLKMVREFDFVNF
ncbi:dynein axonemal assembly factor 6 [Toxorhynchites rutilus septentrionalis]|uniref:dynein axonemal assembly factor 6 n=1 Tax=Toxorhynchites rutilus septentrionalis TaxID=329112 RepID=UPI00247AD3D9|nr:dynein axonemal assembly factor 6 [Toxorhynchites rutilus septentrionalis]